MGTINVMELGIIYDKIRFEEKQIYDKAVEKEINTKLIDAKSIIINSNYEQGKLDFGDFFLQRCLSHFRGVHITKCFEFLDYPIINSYEISETCGNKLKTTLALAKAGIPSPKTYVTFNSESFRKLSEEIGFPFVLKPLVGSWGRGVFPIRNEEMMNMIIETREENDNPFSRIYYVQEMIKRPPRDIRCIVIGDEIITAVYRYSDVNEWRTNVARGGHTEIAPITTELQEIVSKTLKVIGNGILGIDLMEDNKRGFVVHEVNNNVEFRGASKVSNVNIANAIIEYIIKLNKK
ncbi:MAG: lysine biosynthesis protein LysX [Nitrososphaeraceae archaeon]